MQVMSTVTRGTCHLDRKNPSCVLGPPGPQSRDAVKLKGELIRASSSTSNTSLGVGSHLSSCEHRASRGQYTFLLTVSLVNPPENKVPEAESKREE